MVPGVIEVRNPPAPLEGATRLRRVWLHPASLRLCVSASCSLHLAVWAPSVAEETAALHNFSTLICPAIYASLESISLPSRSQPHYGLPFASFEMSTRFFGCRQCRQCPEVDMLKMLRALSALSGSLLDDGLGAPKHPNSHPPSTSSESCLPLESSKSHL